MTMRSVALIVALVAASGVCIGQDECPPGALFYSISLPDGWEILGLGCCGVAASDPENPARGVVALNHIHRGFYMLPPYTSPEAYVEGYMSQDFSLGRNRIEDMRILSYEADQSLASAMAQYSGFMAEGRSMRCSFSVNGIPAEGSFTVVTKELMGYGTTVDFLAGVFAPADQLEREAPMLLNVLGSILILPQYRGLCLRSGGQNETDD